LKIKGEKQISNKNGLFAKRPRKCAYLLQSKLDKPYRFNSASAGVRGCTVAYKYNYRP
jgi:hypothetical protein